MSVATSSYSNLALTDFYGKVEQIAREKNQIGTSEHMLYKFDPGKLNIVVPVFGDVTGGHQVDGTYISAVTNTVSGPTITMDSPLRFSKLVGLDEIAQYGDYIPTAWAEGLASQLMQERQSIILSGIVGSVSDRSSGGAQVSQITNVTDDGTYSGNATYAALTKMRKKKFNLNDVVGFVSPDVFTQLRKVQHIASSLFQRSNAENANLGEAYKVLGATIMTEADALTKNLAQTSNVGSSGATVTYASKYAINMSNIAGVFWHRSAFAVGECEQTRAMASFEHLVQSWVFTARCNFGTKAIKSDGIQLLYL